ncbi:hypothetical protein OSTOST_10093 [Ostertagia ostertagi]
MARILLPHSLADRVFPFLPHELFYAVLVCTVLDIFGFSLFVLPVRTLENLAGYVLHPSPLLHLSCVLVAAVGFVLVFVYAARIAITLLLYYRGWLFESVGTKPSIQTQCFMAVMQLLSKRARFFSFQGLLPWMLPPAVRDTVKTYLKTVRPLLNDEEFDKMAVQADEFEKTIAKDIQRKLWMKWLISKNYVRL